MSCSTDLEVRKAEISALVDGVTSLEHSLGPDVVDYEDRAEAMDILARIERRILASMPIRQEAAE